MNRIMRVEVMMVMQVEMTMVMRTGVMVMIAVQMVGLRLDCQIARLTVMVILFIISVEL